MTKKMSLSPEVFRELEVVLQDIYSLSEDVGEQVKMILKEGRENPLSQEETKKILTTVITILRESAKARDDKETLEAFSGEVDDIVDRIIRVRTNLDQDSTKYITSSLPLSAKQLKLISRNDVKVGPVHPTPWFHGRAVPMKQGYLKTTDITLWDENDRLDIHLSQFRQIYGREPTPEELRDILLSKIALPGRQILRYLNRSTINP